MAIPSFYTPDLRLNSDSLVLSNDEAQHAIKVRRLVTGAEVRLFNGQGITAAARLNVLSRREASVQVVSTQTHPNVEHQYTLACAVPKGDRQRVLVDMLTQLGISELVPLMCEHSVSQFNAKMAEKWQRYTIEACKQSQNPWLMQIHAPMSPTDFLESRSSPMFYLDQSGVSISQLTTHDVTDIAVLIGPEGGFSDSEFAAFERAQVNALKLTPYILRTETAAVAIASVLLSHGE